MASAEKVGGIEGEIRDCIALKLFNIKRRNDYIAFKLRE